MAYSHGQSGSDPGTNCHDSQSLNFCQAANLGVTRETQPGHIRFFHKLIANSRDQLEREIPLLVPVILVPTSYYLLRLFDTPILTGLAHTGYFTDLLSIMIAALILINFLF